MKDFKPHLSILGLIDESSLGMGRQLLASCIIGEESSRVKKLRLNRLVHFNTLPLYDKKDIYELIDLLLYKKFIELRPIPNNKFLKVFRLTDKGMDELNNPSEDLKLTKSFEGYYTNIEKVTVGDKAIFEKLKQYLKGLSDEQKKAVIHPGSNLLCIAGAGSGKTRVITRRAWYLATLRSVDHSKILAITFTRKARKEMMNRLDMLIPNNQIQIETFNSFCEKILRKHEHEIYGNRVKVMDYRTKVNIFLKILSELNIGVDDMVSRYYTKRKQHSTERRTLLLGLINDMFSVLDYQRNNNITDPELMKLVSNHYDQTMSSIIQEILIRIKNKKKKRALRDYTDQIVHTLDFFKTNEDNIPRFEHILIDEYQDINNLQFELIKLLNSKNVFCVGDPRQSIYGWRGSRIDYILDFEKLFDKTSILQLSTNYRSTSNIVDMSNEVIKSMKLPDLKSNNGEEKESVVLIKHSDDNAQMIFITQSILSLETKRNEILILARTNKQIEKMAEFLDKAKIKYLKRTVEEKKANLNPKENEITLSTIHAIKGLEADFVYIIGANTRYHPCRASEHPVLEAIKINDTYDKYAEELRLFYVAITRARKKLIINYSGRLTKYLE